MTRLVAPAVLIAAFVALSFWATAEAPMSDLLATWLAGHFHGLGEVGQVYPADTDLYTMLPPSEWEPYMRARGYPHDIFPFIYPPLWAWAAAPLAAVADPDAWFVAARIANPALIGGMVWLAARATGTRLPAVLFVAIGLFAIGFSNVGQVGLIYGQPQILVSFLTVLAVERAVRGSPAIGGAVMALAAAIKLYPVLYALVWAVAGRWRALAAFAVVGGALGLLSVAVAGWPLHATFLHQVGVIADTVLLTRLNFSLDPVIGQLFNSERFAFVSSAPGAEGGWFIAQKGAFWSGLSQAGIAAVLLVGGLAYRRTGDPLVWPLVMILCSLLTPLSWVYHYLAPVAFAPALLDRLGQRLGGLWLVVCLIPMTLPAMSVIDSLPGSPLPVQGVSVLCFLGLAAGYGLAVARGR